MALTLKYKNIQQLSFIIPGKELSNYTNNFSVLIKKTMEQENLDKTKEGENKETNKNEKTKTARTRNKNKANTSPWFFPKVTLEEAIKVPQAIEEQNAGNPMRADILVRAVGFKKSNDWRFKELLRAANLYGLVDGSGVTVAVAMTSIGSDIVAPGSPSDRQNALVNAFRNVEDFKKVEEFYKEKKLPEDEFFENTLVRQFEIPRERVRTFIEIFTANLNFLKAFKVGSPTLATRIMMDITPSSSSLVLDKPNTAENEIKGRTFLDTCFVMMPFGQWQDAYYKDVFSGAIRGAGMEPVRADELFSTGTVIEQVWEQIQKSKILMADLSGKNANVFYELGLAHAARKPVVFTTSNLEDVPFDLRHLRVIVYDVRDPFWGQKLKDKLTVYLKNAKDDPEKSIPQPFRKIDKDNNEEGREKPRR